MQLLNSNKAIGAPRGASTVRALASATAVCALLLAGATPAFAGSSDADPEAVADAVAAVAPTALDALPLAQSGGELEASFDEGGTIVTGVDPSDGLTIATADGAQVTGVSLPGAAALNDAVVADDGSITFAGDVSVPSVNVLAAEDALRVSTVISAPGQANSFAYDFGVDATVEIQDDGSALVLKDAATDETESDVELIVAVVDAPWASDANGQAIETHYVADGGVLTQIVEHQVDGVEYPVVADPSFDSPNVVQVRARFNRAETATIAVGGWGGVIGAFNCGAMAPVCALASGTLAYQAGVAQNSNPKRCVQVTATSPVIIPGIYWWVDTYRGGPCR